MATRIIDKPIGEILIHLGVIKDYHLEKVLALQQERQNQSLTGELLIESGFAKEEDIVRGLKAQYSFAYLPLTNYSIDIEITKILPHEIAIKHCVIPVHKYGNSLSVAIANPLNKTAIKEIEEISKCKVKVFISTPSDIKNKIKECYKKEINPEPQRVVIEKVENGNNGGNGKNDDNGKNAENNLDNLIKDCNTISSGINYRSEYEDFLNEAKELLSYGYYYSCVAMCSMLAEHIIRNILRKKILGDKSYVMISSEETKIIDTFPSNLICKFLFENELVDKTVVDAFEDLASLRNKYFQIYVKPSEKNARLSTELLENIIKATENIVLSK